MTLVPLSVGLLLKVHPKPLPHMYSAGVPTA